MSSSLGASNILYYLQFPKAILEEKPSMQPLTPQWNDHEKSAPTTAHDLCWMLPLKTQLAVK